jgi:hypothetical protein
MRVPAVIFLLASVPAFCDVIVVDSRKPRDPDAVERALTEMSRKAHEREMQERQIAHEATLQKQRLDAESAARQQQPESPSAPPTTLSFDRTRDMLNGRAWLTWSAEMKVMLRDRRLRGA